MLNAQRLRNLRIEKGLKQSEVAEILNIQRTTYCKYETSDIQPPNDILINIANLFKVSSDYLLNLSNDPTPPNKTKEAAPPLGSEEWLREGLAARGITELTDKQLDILLKNIDFLANQLTDGGE